MRKRYRVLSLAAAVVALAVPLGFALSLEPTIPPTAISSRGAADAAAAPVAMMVAVHAGKTAEYDTPSPADRTLPDAAALMFLGTVLVGLAAAVRRAL